MTANKTYLLTYFPFKTSLLIKRMSLINKLNFKKCFSENYKRMRLTTRVYGINFTDCSITAYRSLLDDINKYLGVVICSLNIVIVPHKMYFA